MEGTSADRVPELKPVREDPWKRAQRVGVDHLDPAVDNSAQTEEKSHEYKDSARSANLPVDPTSTIPMGIFSGSFRQNNNPQPPRTQGGTNISGTNTDGPRRPGGVEK